MMETGQDNSVKDHLSGFGIAIVICVAVAGVAGFFCWLGTQIR